MIYGVTLGGKHTYRDWGLLPKTRPTIANAAVVTQMPEAKTAEATA